MSLIPFEDISFVVQGPIEGAIHKATGQPMTRACLASIRQWCPGAEIVLSTWNGAEVGGLEYDVLVSSADPGAYNFMAEGETEVIYNNSNRQIVSTKNGLAQASRKYAVKLRSDILLTGTKWLNMWDRFPERAPEWRIFRERVITPNLYTRHPLREIPKPFHPSDWFMFGLKEDLQLLWDIEPEPEPEHSWWFRSRPHPKTRHKKDDGRRYQAEQYLWKTLLSKFGAVEFDHAGDASPENIRLTFLTFANNLIVLDVEQFPFVMMKYPTLKRSWRYCCITHREWARLYREYCCGERWATAIERLADAHHFYEACYVMIPSPVRSLAKKMSNRGRQVVSAMRAQ